MRDKYKAPEELRVREKKKRRRGGRGRKKNWWGEKNMGGAGREEGAKQIGNCLKKLWKGTLLLSAIKAITGYPF